MTVNMNIFMWVLLGLVAGIIANIIDPTPARDGLIAAIILGIVGAIIGGFMATTFFGFTVTGVNLQSLAIAVLGSLVLLTAGKALRRV